MDPNVHSYGRKMPLSASWHKASTPCLRLLMSTCLLSLSCPQRHISCRKTSFLCVRMHRNISKHWCFRAVHLNFVKGVGDDLCICVGGRYGCNSGRRRRCRGRYRSRRRTGRQQKRSSDQQKDMSKS